MSLKKALNYIKQMKNKKTFKHDELKGIITYQLKWFKPKEAEKFIQKSIQKNYLEKHTEEEKKLKINTKTQNPNIKMDYTPNINLNNIKPKQTENPVNKMAQHITKNTDKNYKEVIAEMNQKYSKMGKSVNFLIAAYLYGEEKGIDMTKFEDIIDY